MHVFDAAYLLRLFHDQTDFIAVGGEVTDYNELLRLVSNTRSSFVCTGYTRHTTTLPTPIVYVRHIEPAPVRFVATQSQGPGHSRS